MIPPGLLTALWLEVVLYQDLPSSDVGPFLDPPAEFSFLRRYTNCCERAFFRSADGQTNWPELRYHVSVPQEELARMLSARLPDEQGWQHGYLGRSGWRERALGGRMVAPDGKATLVYWVMEDPMGDYDVFVRDLSYSFTLPEIRAWRKLRKKPATNSKDF